MFRFGVQTHKDRNDLTLQSYDIWTRRISLSFADGRLSITRKTGALFFNNWRRKRL